jgi:hypothetical protein
MSLATSMNSSHPWLSSASSATSPVFAVNSALHFIGDIAHANLLQAHDMPPAIALHRICDVANQPTNQPPDHQSIDQIDQSIDQSITQLPNYPIRIPKRSTPPP